MVTPTTFHIRSDTYAWCEMKVSVGRFKTFSDMLDFALGIYLDSIEREGMKSIPKLTRVDLVRKSARVNTWVMDRLMETGFFERSEIADYALDFYRRWLGEDE